MPASFKIETNAIAGTLRSNDTAVSSTSARVTVARRAADRLGGKLGVYRARPSTAASGAMVIASSCNPYANVCKSLV